MKVSHIEPSGGVYYPPLPAGYGTGIPKALGALALAGLATVTPWGKVATLGYAGLRWLGLRVFYQATKPRNWLLYNAYKEYNDIKHFLKGGDFTWGVDWTATRPLRWKGYFHRPLAVVIPFPWIDLQSVHKPIPSITVEESSSRDLVQNGGSSAPPPLMEAEATFNRNVKRLTAGLTPSSSSAHGSRPGRAPAAGGKSRSRRWCPARKWNRPCLLPEGHKGPHHFQSNPG